MRVWGFRAGGVVGRRWVSGEGQRGVAGRRCLVKGSHDGFGVCMWQRHVCDSVCVSQGNTMRPPHTPACAGCACAHVPSCLAWLRRLVLVPPGQHLAICCAPGLRTHMRRRRGSAGQTSYRETRTQSPPLLRMAPTPSHAHAYAQAHMLTHTCRMHRGTALAPQQPAAPFRRLRRRAPRPAKTPAHMRGQPASSTTRPEALSARGGWVGGHCTCLVTLLLALIRHSLNSSTANDARLCMHCTCAAQTPPLSIEHSPHHACDTRPHLPFAAAPPPKHTHTRPALPNTRTPPRPLALAHGPRGPSSPVRRATWRSACRPG